MTVEKYGGIVTNYLERRFKDAKIIIRHVDGKEEEVGKFIVERRELRKDKRRPDIVLWININLEIFGDKAKIRVPILIELERSGLNSAREDFKNFFKQPEIETTGIVLGGDRAIRGWEHKVESYNTKIILHIRQNPDYLEDNE